MSNENSITNLPKFIKRGNSSARYRKFSCITYLTEIQIKLRLLEHSNQIRVYAYAYHDKDVREDGTFKEPHFHLIIVTYTTCTVSAIRRWFSGVKDSNGNEITTTVQNCTDVFEMYDYLIHDTVQARNAGKYKYDSSIRVTNDKGYFKADEVSHWDNIVLASEMLLKGESIQDIGRRFGRDFIFHYGAIEKYVFRILEQRKYHESLEEIHQREYELEIARLNNDI